MGMSGKSSSMKHDLYNPQAGKIFASDASCSRGRVIAEPESRTRTPFQRDRDRIIHSRAFRRLKDKTQVFIYDEGDHYRTRLTHTIEVAQIARSISRALGLDEDLAEALALSHDLGHPPFGHAGETALNECMKDFGGFDHNAQSLRVVTKLERAYADFDGLNLCWETLEGLVKHNGPLLTGDMQVSDLPHALQAYDQVQDLWLWSFASAEAQAAAIADDIAYDAHDVDDALRAGLFQVDDLKETLLGQSIVREVDERYSALEPFRRQHEVTRRLITRLIEDAIDTSRSRLSKLSGSGADDVRKAKSPVIAFSERMQTEEADLKQFLRAKMYRHERVMSSMNAAKLNLSRLFEVYFANTALLPEDWQQGLLNATSVKKARRICDFIAGMTDRFALQESARLARN